MNSRNVEEKVTPSEKRREKDLCGYSDVYIVVKGTITGGGTNANNRSNKLLALTNNGPFRSCISKINAAFIDKLEDFDVMPMYNVLGNSDNYSITSGSL